MATMRKLALEAVLWVGLLAVMTYAPIATLAHMTGWTTAEFIRIHK